MENIRADFFENRAPTKLFIPKNVQSIEEGTFYGCDSLKSVDFEDGSQLTSIEKDTFRKCVNLESVRFGVGAL